MPVRTRCKPVHSCTAATAVRGLQRDPVATGQPKLRLVWRVAASRTDRRIPPERPVFEPLIPQVLDDLAALQPDWLVPAHCTGWRAQHAMSARLGDVYVPNAVGTGFHS